MKKSFIILCTLLIGLSCSAASYLGMKLPLPGASIADKKTQGNTLCYVFSRVAQKNKGCRNLKVTNTEVTKEPTDVKLNQFGRKVGGTWTEEWTVDACGTDVKVPIDFVYRRNGVMSTINYSVK